MTKIERLLVFVSEKFPDLLRIYQTTVYQTFPDFQLEIDGKLDVF